MILTYLPYYEEFGRPVASPYMQLVQIQETEDSQIYNCFVWTKTINPADFRFWKKNRSTRTELTRWCSFGHPRSCAGLVNGLWFTVSQRHYNIGVLSLEDIQRINAKQLLQQELNADTINLSLLLQSIITNHARALQERAINDKRSTVSQLTSPRSKVRRAPLRPHVDWHPVDLRGTDAIPASARISLDDL